MFTNVCEKKMQTLQIYFNTKHYSLWVLIYMHFFKQNIRVTVMKNEDSIVQNWTFC